MSFFLEFRKDELLVSGDVGSKIGNEFFFFSFKSNPSWASIFSAMLMDLLNLVVFVRCFSFKQAWMYGVFYFLFFWWMLFFLSVSLKCKVLFFPKLFFLVSPK